LTRLATIPAILSPTLSPICRAVTVICMGGAVYAAHADPPATTDETESRIVPGERLSAWLNRQAPLGGNRYLLALRWDVPEERAAQAEQKQHLLRELLQESPPSPTTAAPPAASLARWLETLPVTGRALIANADGRWLEANPQEDPVLRAGQSVSLPLRPTTATVVMDDGLLCQVPYQANAPALAYLRACTPDSDQRDTVWIAQPDGRSLRYGIGLWNAQSQLPPAAGAWIWAPSRRNAPSEAVSEALIRFLATQGVAPDGLGRQAHASLPDDEPVPGWRQRGFQQTASDWGEIGLLQTPTARMAPAGSIRLAVSHTQPYLRATTMFQPLDWLEGGFRYSQIGNRPYDASHSYSEQSYKDKSLDFKVRLWQESAWIPEVALGVRDLGGTGLFSGEYVVGSKRTGDLDWSLGLGWGYLGGRGNLKNPLSMFGSRFDTRPTATGTGEANGRAYFRGPTSLFGGVQWQTPFKDLLLKLEYDGNDYQHEPLGNVLRQRSPLNIGAVYRLSDHLDFSFGVERGERLMLSLTLHGALNTLNSPKFLDPPAPVASPLAPVAEPAWDKTVADVHSLTGWTVAAIDRDGDTLHVTVTYPRGLYAAGRLERMTAVLHRDAPATIRRFSLDFVEQGMHLGTKTIQRADWVALHTELLSPEQRQNRGQDYLSGPVASAQPKPVERKASTSPWQDPGQPLQWGLSPSLWSSLGGPDSFLLYQVGVKGSAELRLTEGTWLTGAANFRLIDNYDQYKYTAPSMLPRVRTHIKEYVTTSRFTLNNLQINHAEQLGQHHFVMGYAGLFESMFGGVGAEYLYRTPASPLAFGVDINRVRQRGFGQDFTFRDYRVTTGQATVYWQTGWNGVQVNLSVGQYLAGDRGATLDISRRFDNGVSMGFYATKTNLSAAQYGEGSFDKGIYVRFPFDAIMPRSSTTTGTITWQPLLRDGGARLGRSQGLYGLTALRDTQAFQLKPATRNPVEGGDE
jgi:hypothetical protein